jgi:hypothetical protein
VADFWRRTLLTLLLDLRFQDGDIQNTVFWLTLLVGGTALHQQIGFIILIIIRKGTCVGSRPHQLTHVLLVTRACFDFWADGNVRQDICSFFPIWRSLFAKKRSRSSSETSCTYSEPLWLLGCCTLHLQHWHRCHLPGTLEISRTSNVPKMTGNCRTASVHSAASKHQS